MTHPEEIEVGPSRDYIFLDRIRREVRYALAGLVQDSDNGFEKFEVAKGGYLLTDSNGTRYLVRYDVAPPPP